MKWFRERRGREEPAAGAKAHADSAATSARLKSCADTKRSRPQSEASLITSWKFGIEIALGAAAVGVFCVTASASMVVFQSPGFLLGAGNSIAQWLANAESGSGVEKALYRLMKLPGGEALYRRSPRESRPELTALIDSSKNSAGLYSLRALEDEEALDFEAAEKDWKNWAQMADDKAAANLDLADFYERRLKPQEELAALEAVGSAAASPQERWTAIESQQSWKAWERTQAVVVRFALGRAVAQREYAGWERRYSGERSVYERELAFEIEGRDFSAASELIGRYRKAFPTDTSFPVRAEAEVEAGRGSAKDGLAVFDRSFEPLWPTELVKGYYDLLVSSHLTLRTRDALRAKLAANPDGGVDALKDAAKLFYIFQQQGQVDAAKAVLAEYRTRTDARGAAWSADELYTLARLMEEAQDFTEAARYYYALAADHKNPDTEVKGLAGLTRILLTSPDQPLRVGAGNLALYKSIATMDRGPGYLNGILSLFLNSQEPDAEYANEDQAAAPYFHRAKAAELLAEIDQRFPKAEERAELHVKLMDVYAVYGENEAVIQEGTAFLAQFPVDKRRVEVALAVGDVYSRMKQPEKEFALYKNLLRELAERADGVPLGVPGPQYSKPVDGEAAGGVRSSEYAQVLDRYLSRLVALDRLPDALELLRGELDRNPQDPGLYERLAAFLEQNRLDAREEAVYERAIAQFQSTSFGSGWYCQLARFYLRQKRNADYSALSRKVVGIFSGTELEKYLRQAPAPDSRLALEVELYAHDRFPHDLTFVNDLLAQYRSRNQFDEAEKLLWAHWAESPDLRDELFSLLSRSGRLDAQLDALRQQSTEIDKADWTALAQSNPAAERFWLQSCLWQSKFEQGVGAAEALANEYPADEMLGRQASSLERSLAYFHPEDTDKAVAIEKRLLSAKPDDLETMARIGDIYADRGRMAEAAPYWTRMAEVHPGNADGYLQSATVFWDYFDFASASTALRQARERLAEPALFGYQAGAIDESQGNFPAAVAEYVASALGDKPSEESRSRLLALARRPELRAAIEAATAGLLKQAAPTSAAIELRVNVLDAEHRTADVAQELKQAVAQTDSFDVLDALTQAARARALPEVEQLALCRQIALTADPAHSLELRYQLVELLQQHDQTKAATEVDAIYREHGKILGVVRATVDYDWGHERKPQAVMVLLESAEAAYPELKQHFQLEAARKLTELGEYPRAKQLLEPLLSEKPLDAGIEAALADNYARSGDEAGLEVFYKAELTGVKASSLDQGEKTMRLAQLRRGMVSAAAMLGHWDEAVDQYIELINAYPADAGLAEEAALAAGAHGQHDKLLGFYRKTVEASPRDARWSIVLARLETALEDYPAAIEGYAKAIHVRPEQKDLYQSKAELEERLHKLDDAVIDYEQLYKLSYRDPQWMVNVAQARARQGRDADAVKALEEAWINGRPQTTANYFETATRLEQWGLLEDARKLAEQGVEIAGADLLVDPEDQSGGAIYARIMARLRQSDTAFTRLAAARQQAEVVPLAAVAQQVVKDGPGVVTSEEWRRRRVAERTSRAARGFAEALKSMGTAVGEFYTPEEKAQFAAWLQSKRAIAANDIEMHAVYLPATKAAGLVDMEAELRWQFAQGSGRPESGDLNAWLQLERSRVQLEGAGAKIEALAASLHPRQQRPVWEGAAGVYRTMGDDAAELRVLDKLAEMGQLTGNARRYYQLLLAARPDDLVRRAGQDNVAQFLVENAKPDLAMAGIAARSGRPPVWKKAYTGLTGLYLGEHTAEVRESFAGALGGDAAIGERVTHAADRREQLAGEVWFYYGSRYGEYLDEEKDSQAEGYLEAELEHTPEIANAYTLLADYSAEAGRAEAALADYRHSLELNRDQPAVLDSMAAVEWKQGRQGEALAAWQLAVKRLANEMDARKVQERFWGDFAQVLGAVAAHGQYAAISEQVDAMLRGYLARNGLYRAEPLLEAGYHAHGDSMQWLIEICAAANDPAEVLLAMQRSDWILKSQMSQLDAHLVELERSKAHGNPGESDYALDQAESNLVAALLDEKKIAEARVELSRISEEKLNSSQWVGAELRLAEADGSLAPLIAQWKKHPDSAPASSDLTNAVNLLNEASKRLVMRFVYEQALNLRELTAPNFLGLAAIDLDENDVLGAVALLKRLTLISSNGYADTDSAASLLETRSRFSEAVPFLELLAEAFPWNASYKIRLAVATLAGNAQSQAAHKVLAVVAADPKATYAERLAAAKALKGRGPANSASGSAELDQLARAKCPSADEANKPYFVETRMAAAACATDDKERERILRSAIATAPDNTELRLQYVRAAFGVGLDARALLASEPILQSGGFYGARFAQSENEALSEGDVGRQRLPALPELKPADAAKLTWFAIHAREKRHEAGEALALVRNALPMERDDSRRVLFVEEQKRLEMDAARARENEERAPKIHNDLDQAGVVRRRIALGTPVKLRRPANGEEDAQ